MIQHDPTIFFPTSEISEIVPLLALHASRAHALQNWDSLPG